MKIGVIGAVCLGSLGYVGLAGAETPAERTGFQMALRTGVAIPFGEIDKGEKMSDFTSVQVPLIVDVGAKVIPQLFLGGYFGFGFGGAGGDLADSCSASSASCVSVGLRIGIEAQYHILPRGSVNPWLGYGIGYESLALSIGNDSRDTASVGSGGLEFAHFMAGADVRLSRGFGIGPFVDVALGRYSTFSTDLGNGHTISSDIDDSERATHGWAMLGARMVFFP
jgi:hypothetical protein